MKKVTMRDIGAAAGDSTVTVSEKLRERGVRVSEDVSVTGFDAFTDAAPTDVPLSTFRVDTDGMIELALKAITERCSGSRKPFGRMVVSGQPVYRQSEKALE